MSKYVSFSFGNEAMAEIVCWLLGLAFARCVFNRMQAVLRN